jgi:hypothetical protein
VTGQAAKLLLGDSEPSGALLLLALLVIVQAGVAAAWLRRVHLEQAA